MTFTLFAHRRAVVEFDLEDLDILARVFDDLCQPAGLNETAWQTAVAMGAAFAAAALAVAHVPEDFNRGKWPA